MDKQQAAALKTLTKARKLIAKKNGWIKGAEEVKITGKYAGPNLRDNQYEYADRGTGDAFCAYGAIRRADGPGEALAVRLLIQGIRVFRGLAPAKNIEKASNNENSIFKFNDAKKRTQEEVLAAFDNAIKMIDVDEEAANNA